MQTLQTVTLGKNDSTLTRLGIGTWAWGDKLFGAMAAITMPSKSKPRLKQP
uniref:Uncharacterized protein n=1 Tax=Desertifilum tharense IPPAS B-1220 TaxID=1781255 RepID=A0ACD5H0S6_9CYAN